MRDEMKKVPRLRFRGFSEDWELCKLGTLAEIVRGASPRPIQDSKWFDNTSDVGWLRISDVTEQNGRIYKLEQKLSKAGQEKTRVLRKPHLLLSIAATVGKPVVNYVNTGVHDGFLIFLNPLFDREFMFQWLEMFTPKWQKYGQPGSQLNLNSELVRNQELRMPSTNEQEKIGMLFQYLDDTITLHQRKFDQLKKLKKAYLQAMFVSMNTKNNKVPKLRFTDFEGDWELCKLGEVFDFKQGVQVPVEEQFTTLEEGMQRFIRIVDLTTDEEPPRYIKYDSDNLVSESDLFMVRYGAVGVIGLGYEGVIANNLFKLIPRIVVDEKFSYHQLIKNKDKIISLSSSTTMPALSFKTLKNLSFSVPSVGEQKQIGSFFANLDNLITLHQNKLEQLNELKKSYLQNMFI
ncbi:restriction endonuclease subunit S [Enterococcus faecalis]|nr:restriction endonuclease subunit S [Enterococcus faecalis]